MEYPFLKNNELILIDYLPGSSGQLLMRLWSELDSSLNYKNDKILSGRKFNSHNSSQEISYDIIIPKRIINWFLDNCDPCSNIDYLQFFEFLGTFLLAYQQQWLRENKIKFYENSNYVMNNYRILYGIHSWDKVIPFNEIQELGYNIKCISIIPKTDIGLQYQFKRGQICFPTFDSKFWEKNIYIFNQKKTTYSFDFCTLLVTKNTNEIINWLRNNIGQSFRQDKIPHVINILETYYLEIVDHLS